MAKLSMTELRARQGVCSAQCDTYSCYKGSPATPPEGLATDGCPLHSHPAQLVDNRDCVLCMTCLKACPHSSIEVRLRPPAADIWGGGHRPLAAEAALQWILFGAVAVHHLPALLSDFGIEPAGVLEPRLAHCAAAAAVLAAPGLVAWGADAAWRAAAGALAPAPARAALAPAGAGAAGAGPDAARALSVLAAASASYAGSAAGAPVVAPQKPFLDLSYGYLPLVWAATLAHYLAPLLLEAGHTLPIAARTFAPLTGALEPLLPAFEADSAVVAFLQGSTLLFGAGASLVLSRRVAGQPWRTIAPQCALIAAFTAEVWHLILGAPL
jgi:NAD-dependent dihydropyrimidine dehydrogenase PreA subunit